MVLTGIVCAAQSQAGTPTAGVIARLSETDQADAVACGRRGADCAVAPYQLCPSEIGGRYAAEIATPYSRVAKAAFERAKIGRPARGMERGSANRWGMGIYVYPAERSARAEAIQRVEIRREDRVLQPLTTTVAPISVTGPDGSTKRLTRGYFAFADEAFDPSAAATVVFVGSGGTATCTLDRAHLRTLR